MGYFVRRAARLDGTVTFRSASIGWFSPASVSGIEIHDAQGETVLEADNLTCDRSLLKLLFNSSNVGTLRIEKPRLHARLARDGSNIESILAPWLTATSSSTASSPSPRRRSGAASRRWRGDDRRSGNAAELARHESAVRLGSLAATALSGGDGRRRHGRRPRTFGRSGLQMASQVERCAAGRPSFRRHGVHRWRFQPANHHAPAGLVPAPGGPWHARAEARRHARREPRTSSGPAPPT